MQHQHIAQHQVGGGGAPNFGQQLMDIHTNALPGITRPEEGEVPYGEERPANMSYDALERFRARERYEEYLDEQDSSKLPNAFDHGWRKNLLDLFGSRPLLWLFPVHTTRGDGWTWEASQKWIEARDRLKREREEQQQRENVAGWGAEPTPHFPQPSTRNEGAGRHYLTTPSPSSGIRFPSKADRVLGRDPLHYTDDSPEYRMQTLKRHEPLDADDYDSSSDEIEAEQRNKSPKRAWGSQRIAPASGILGKGQTKAPANEEFSRWDANHDESVD